MRTLEITCKGCWRIVALGLSFDTYKEAVYKDGEFVAYIEKALPAHDEEVCPVCGTVHQCGDLGGWFNEQGRLLSDEYDREREPREITRFLYRGPIEGPIPVDDPVHYLLDNEDDDVLGDQWS